MILGPQELLDNKALVDQQDHKDHLVPMVNQVLKALRDLKV